MKEDTTILLEFKQRYTKKMTEVLGKEAVARYEKPTLEYPGKRCGMCLEDIIGHKKQRKTNWAMKTVCYKCKHAVCAKHTVVTCQKWHEGNT